MKEEPVKRVLKPRVCAVCGRPGGTVACTLTLKWLREADASVVPHDGDYAHLKCIRAADAIAAARKKGEGR